MLVNGNEVVIREAIILSCSVASNYLNTRQLLACDLRTHAKLRVIENSCTVLLLEDIVTICWKVACYLLKIVP